MQNEKVDLCLREATPEDESFLFEVYASTRIEELEGTGWNDEQKLAFIRMQFLLVKGPILESIIESFF